MKKVFLFPPFSMLILFLSFSLLSAASGFCGKQYFPSKKQETAPQAITFPLPETVTLLHNGTVSTLPLEEYLYGVVAGEMPASFLEEALKAQAVAARTYTVNRSRYENDTHPDANVCSNPAHCKAYLSPSELSEKFKNTPEGLQKIKKAVDDTKNEIAIYNNQPISAVFHSTSSGRTENSRDVWGGDVPYLVSVVSEGEEESPRYTETKTFSPEDFKKRVNASSQTVAFTENFREWFSALERNESGSVRSLNICGVTFKGTELRTLLGLRSANFEIAVTDSITITTKGNGHGVGMSQYGANYMAKQGYRYDEILKKYYTGIAIANQK